MRVLPVALTLAILLAGCADQAADPPAAAPAPDPEPPAAPAPTADPPREDAPVVPNPSQQTLDAVLSNGEAWSMSAPADWTFSPGRMGVELFVVAPLDGPGDGFRENVNLLLEQVGDMSPEEYDRITLEGVATVIEDGEVLAHERARFAGRDAMRLDYTGRIGELDGRWIGWYFLEDGFAYVFTYTAQTGHEAIELAEAMAASMTIGEPDPASPVA